MTESANINISVCTNIDIGFSEANSIALST